jgi:hypothetical protein
MSIAIQVSNQLFLMGDALLALGYVPLGCL